MPYVFISTIALCVNLYRCAPLIVGDKYADPEVMRFLGAKITTDYPEPNSPPMYVMYATLRSVLDALQEIGFDLKTTQAVQGYYTWIMAKPVEPPLISHIPPKKESEKGLSSESGSTLTVTKSRENVSAGHSRKRLNDGELDDSKHRKRIKEYEPEMDKSQRRKRLEDSDPNMTKRKERPNGLPGAEPEMFAQKDESPEGQLPRRYLQMDNHGVASHEKLAEHISAELRESSSRGTLKIASASRTRSTPNQPISLSSSRDVWVRSHQNPWDTNPRPKLATVVSQDEDVRPTPASNTNTSAATSYKPEPLKGSVESLQDRSRKSEVDHNKKIKKARGRLSSDSGKDKKRKKKSMDESPKRSSDSSVVKEIFRD